MSGHATTHPQVEPPHTTESQRKQSTLAQHSSSRTSSIAQAIAMKNDDTFLLCSKNAQIPFDDDHGYGLYFNDCRYISGYSISLNGTDPQSLGHSQSDGFSARFELTNLGACDPKGSLVPHALSITCERLLDGASHMLRDAISFHNYGMHDAQLPVTLSFRVAFEDMFVVRGQRPPRTNRTITRTWSDNLDSLNCAFSGEDGVGRRATIAFDPAPQSVDELAATFDLAMPAGKTVRVAVTIQVGEYPDGASEPSEHSPEKIHKRLRATADSWHDKRPQVTSDSRAFDRVFNRAMADMQMLVTKHNDLRFFAAGVPWFVTLFGRDSAISAMQMLPFRPEIAAETLRLLAHYQGKQRDEFTDEERGKILHELRWNELTRAGQLPYTPYYGSVDSTLLFLILAVEHARFTGSCALWHELSDHLQRALDWTLRKADEGDGFLGYRSETPSALIQKGWKDSTDSISNADGSLATQPIYLAEVQSYAYRAWLGAASIHDRLGDLEQAATLRTRAAQLRANFHDAFWQPDDEIYLLALQDHHEPVHVVTSNAGQVLWGGIAHDEPARMTAERLMHDDMFTGWGIRTLSNEAVRYNPNSYHNGSVWPHDNALVAAGMRHYGHSEPATRICNGILAAATRFADARLPELFAGFSRAEHAVPINYPVACHPQAWAAGSVPHMLLTMLGVHVDSFEHVLTIDTPVLPLDVGRLTLERLRVGDAMATVTFMQTPDGAVSVEVDSEHGDVSVELRGADACK